MEDDMLNYNGICVLQSFNISYNPEEWKLFIDSSKKKLKAALLHNGNVLHSIPISHAIPMK